MFFIKLVFVPEPDRRTGVGTTRIEHLIGLMPPGKKLWTSTSQSNGAMRALLPRLGFIDSERIHNLDAGDPERRLFAWPSGDSGRFHC